MNPESEMLRREMLEVIVNVILEPRSRAPGLMAEARFLHWLNSTTLFETASAYGVSMTAIRHNIGVTVRKIRRNKTFREYISE